MVLSAVSNSCSESLKYTRATLCADRVVVHLGMENNDHVLEYVSEALRKDREVILAAVRTNGGVLGYADEVLKSDPLFLKAAIETSPSCIERIGKTRRQQLYDLISPLSIVSFHCGEALAEDKLTGLITGLMTLSYHSPLRASVGSDERPHSREGFNWNHDVSLSTLRYLSVKDIVRLMRTPANVYVKESDGSERPCHQEQIDGFFFNTRALEDEMNKERYLTSGDFKDFRCS